MSDITWRYDAPEDLIKKEVLARYSCCVAAQQSLDRYRMRTGKYPGNEAREFIGHVTGLWRYSAVLVKFEPGDIDKVHSLKGMGARLEFATKQFYKLAKKLRVAGILSLRSRARLVGREKGKMMALGIE